MTSFFKAGLIAAILATTGLALPAQDHRRTPDESVLGWAPLFSAIEPSSKRHSFQPCLGVGYVPYSYPGFETCPCGNDGCFHPAPYYCGGHAYRKQWLRKWVRAHLGHGSMLDDYPCHCIFPTIGNPVVQNVPRPAVDTATPSPQSRMRTNRE